MHKSSWAIVSEPAECELGWHKLHRWETSRFPKICECFVDSPPGTKTASRDGRAMQHSSRPPASMAAFKANVCRENQAVRTGMQGPRSSLVNRRLSGLSLAISQLAAPAQTSWHGFGASELHARRAAV